MSEQASTAAIDSPRLLLRKVRSLLTAPGEREWRAARESPLLDPTTAALVARAEDALELAGRGLRDDAPLPHGSGVDLAIVLSAHAVSLCAQAGASIEDDAKQTLETAALPLHTLSEPEREHLLGAISTHARRSLASFRSQSVSDLRRRTATVWALRGIVGVAAVVAATLLVWGLVFPDYAAHATWRTSSTYAGLLTEVGECDGAPTTIFFHTNQERDPFIEYDLGTARSISAVDIRNRFGFEARAMPLEIKTSLDGRAWTEVGRRDAPFQRWKAEFPKTSARYVRITAKAVTFLHLEKVSIR